MHITREGINKPLADIQKVINVLGPLSTPISSLPRRTYYFTQGNQSFCYLLQEGYAALHRVSDGMVIDWIKSPMFLGLGMQLINNNETYFFTTESHVQLSRLTVSQAKESIAKAELWESVAIQLAYFIWRMSINSSQMSGLSSYEIIRFQLINLMSEPDEIRENITAAQYVQERTLLSRSGIMKLLALFKAEHYIVIEKGILTAINEIPLKI